MLAANDPGGVLVAAQRPIPGIERGQQTLLLRLVGPFVVAVAIGQCGHDLPDNGPRGFRASLSAGL